jgi:hypothetical protein
LRILSTGIEEYKEFAKKPSREIDRVREDIILRTRILEEREKTLEEKTEFRRSIQSNGRTDQRTGGPS